MRVCFDTNVIIDIWGKTNSFFASYSALDTAISTGMEVSISVGSLSDFVYILASRKHASKRLAREMISEVIHVFEILDLTFSDCQCANLSDMKDFEDALIAYSAKRSNVDFIVTRNKKVFKVSPVPALTPEDFLSIYKPDYLDYELIDT